MTPRAFVSLPAARGPLRAQVARHPLVAFVALAYAISWTCWLVFRLVETGVLNGLLIVGATGPALAAMFVSAILDPEPSGASVWQRWRLFGLILAAVLGLLILRRIWLAAGLTVVQGRAATMMNAPTIAVAVDALAASVVALVLSGVRSSRRGVRDLLRSLSPWQMPLRWHWVVLAVGLYPAVMVLGNAIVALAGLPAPAPRVTGAWHWLVLEALLLFGYVLLCGGGLEEPGWRGFALPHLQAHYSPLRASLILAVIWGFWHWPLFWFGYYGGGPLGVLAYVLGTVPLAILFTAVFNRSGGSLPIVILLHSSINATPSFISATDLAVGLWMLLILIVAIGMWRKPRTFASRNPQNQYVGVSRETP